MASGKVLFGLAMAACLSLPAAPSDATRRLMFGPEKVPDEMKAFAGFEYVSSSNAMLSGGATSPWRYEPRGSAGVWTSMNTGGLPADVLLEHGILCARKTTLVVPFRTGKCRVHVWVGDWFRGWERLIDAGRTQNRHELNLGKGNDTVRLAVGGRVVYEIPMTTENTYREWCKTEDYVFSRHDDIWDRIVRPVLTELDFEAEARDGAVSLVMDNILLTAVVVAKDEQEMKAALSEIEQARRAMFAARYPWKPQPDEALPAAAKKGGDCLVFRKGVSDSVFPWTRPTDDEVTDEIFTFAAQGEQQAVRLGFLPLRDLKGVDVEVGDFSCHGETLAIGGCSDLWMERYKETGALRQNGRIESMPALDPVSGVLQKPRRVDWERETPRLYLLDLRVPAKLTPGDWIAPVRVTSDGKTVKTARIRVKVMPFSLAAYAADSAAYGFQDVAWAWAYDAPIKSWPDGHLRYHRDYHGFIARYGFSNFMLMPAFAKCLTFEGELGKTRVFQTEANRQAMARLRDIVDPSRTETFFALEFIRYFQLCGWKGSKVKYGKTMTPQEQDRWSKTLSEVGRLAKEVERIFRENGWPPLRFYAGGEFDNGGPATVARAIELCRALRKCGVSVQVVTNGPLACEKLPTEADHVWANPATPITEDFAARIRAAGNRFGSHNCGDSRFMTGLQFWRTGSEGRYQETVFYTSFLWPCCLLPWNYQASLVLPAPDGRLRPTRNFLAYRDAKNDYLYLHALERAAAQANADSPVRRDAERFLAELRAKVAFDPRCYFAGEVHAIEGSQTMAETGWNEFALNRMRWRAATLLSQLAADGRSSTYTVHLPCAAGALETYYLDLDAAKADATTLALTDDKGRAVPFSLNERLTLPRPASGVNIAPDGRFSHERALAEEDRFRSFGWFSFRAPEGATSCTLTFKGGADRKLGPAGDPTLRPWWVATVASRRAKYIPANKWWAVSPEDMPDLSQSGGRAFHTWIRLSAPDLPDGTPQQARFWSESDVPGFYQMARCATAYMELIDGRTYDSCCVGRVRMGAADKIAQRVKQVLLVLPYELKTIDVKAVQMEFPPESAFVGLVPATDQYIPGDTLRYKPLPDPMRETLVAFEDGGVRGERVVVPGAAFKANSVLTDEKGNVAKDWMGFEMVVDVPPGAYRLESTLFAGKTPFMHTTHEIRVLQSPERMK